MLLVGKCRRWRGDKEALNLKNKAESTLVILADLRAVMVFSLYPIQSTTTTNTEFLSRSSAPWGQIKAKAQAQAKAVPGFRFCSSYFVESSCSLTHRQ